MLADPFFRASSGSTSKKTVTFRYETVGATVVPHVVPESAVSEVLTFEPQAKPCDPFASFSK